MISFQAVLCQLGNISGEVAALNFEPASNKVRIFLSDTDDKSGARAHRLLTKQCGHLPRFWGRPYRVSHSTIWSCPGDGKLTGSQRSNRAILQPETRSGNRNILKACYRARYVAYHTVAAALYLYSVYTLAGVGLV